MAKVINLNANTTSNQLNFTRFLYSFPKFNLGSLTIIFLCIICMLIATFTLIPVGIYDAEMLSDTFNYFSDVNNLLLTLHSHLYSPQIPVVIFIGALLGPRLGTFCMLLYVSLGLVGVPFFAAGGGPGYVFEPVFGFILGFILAAYFVGKIFSQKVNSIDIILAALFGVVTIHFFGVLYLIANLHFSGSSMEAIKAWVWSLSFINLPYDIIFGLVLCSLARPIRGLLWIAMD